MSQENVEIVRRGIDHWNMTGDFDWTVMDDDVEWVVDPDAWLGDTYRGREGIRTMLARLAEAFDGFQLEVERYVDAGDGGHARPDESAWRTQRCHYRATAGVCISGTRETHRRRPKLSARGGGLEAVGLRE
jgi:ketosteroid isomerase-like protein